MDSHLNNYAPRRTFEGRFHVAVCVLTLLITGCGQVDDGDSANPSAVVPIELDSKAEYQLWPAMLDIRGLELMRIPAGEFIMGSDKAPNDTYSKGESPAHRVRISSDFYLGKCEVTVCQFRAFVDATGYQTDVERNGEGANSLNLQTGQIEQRPTTVWHSPGFLQTDDHPVVCVSWNDAATFCDWLSKETKLNFRLPTEAEWEYSCRAGSQTKFCTGDDPYSLEGFVNMGDSTLLAVFPKAGGTAPWSDGAAFCCKVASFTANAFGLHDMHGNVGEWCSDWYSQDFYQHSPTTDPVGPTDQSETHPWHSVRGGSWFNAAHSCRSSGRHDAIETAPSTTNGFRVLLEINR